MLYSLKPYPIDYIIAVDGKFKDFDKDKGKAVSDIEVIKLLTIAEANNKHTRVKHITATNRTETEKRQLYFDECAYLDIDILIIIDSDEYIIGPATNWDLFTQDLYYKINSNNTYRQGYCIPTLMGDTIYGKHSDIDGSVWNLPRLFYKPADLQYVDDHCTIRNRKTGIIQTYEGNTVCQHIVLGHDHNLRTKDYQDKTRAYQTLLIKKEREERSSKQNDYVRS